VTNGRIVQPVRFAIAISLAVLVIGLVLAIAFKTIGGMLLVIGAVAALGLFALPEVIDRFATFLSTGRIRRR
jgi:hypothetical protein